MFVFDYKKIHSFPETSVFIWSQAAAFKWTQVRLLQYKSLTLYNSFWIYYNFLINVFAL